MPSWNKIKVEAGDRYGWLAILKEVQPKNGHRRFYCKCDCGNTTTVCLCALRNGHTKSCGCLRNETIAKRQKTHGQTVGGETLTYFTWCAIKQRCLNKKNKDYLYYGGRGITVCDKWLRFEGFFEDMGEKPKGLTLERIDNNKGYSLNNCKWATRQEQNDNTRVCIPIAVNGMQFPTFTAASRYFNIHRDTVQSRLKRGLSIEQAFTREIYSRS